MTSTGLSIPWCCLSMIYDVFLSYDYHPLFLVVCHHSSVLWQHTWPNYDSLQRLTVKAPDVWRGDWPAAFVCFMPCMICQAFSCNICMICHLKTKYFCLCIEGAALLIHANQTADVSVGQWNSNVWMQNFPINTVIIVKRRILKLSTTGSGRQVSLSVFVSQKFFFRVARVTGLCWPDFFNY